MLPSQRRLREEYRKHNAEQAERELANHLRAFREAFTYRERDPAEVKALELELEARWRRTR